MNPTIPKHLTDFCMSPVLPLADHRIDRTSPGSAVSAIRRAHLVSIARSFLGTPYHRGARLKGVGVDCATFLGECLIEAGLSTEAAVYGGLGVYRMDWWLHAAEERYMLRLLRHAQKAMEGVACRSSKIEPGNLVLSRVVGSRKYNHGGIVLQWPIIAHALKDGGVREADATRHPMWAFHEIAVFDPFAGSGSEVRTDQAAS
jgi:cell wall-associated NlpC family hydrolase